jgi:hypothetical protein
VDHQPNPYDGDGPTFSGEEILIVPNPELDAWCEGQDRIEGVDRWRWATKDAAVNYRKSKSEIRNANDECRVWSGAQEEYEMARQDGAAHGPGEGRMGRTDRQAREFRNLTPGKTADQIVFDDRVRRRIGRAMRRAERFQNWGRRVKANAPLFIAAMAVGAILVVIAGEMLGWM